MAKDKPLPSLVLQDGILNATVENIIPPPPPSVPRAAGKRIVVKKVKVPPGTTSGGIITPENSSTPLYSEVLSIGTEARKYLGSDVEVGDFILHRKGNGLDLGWFGTDYILINAEDVLSKCEFVTE